MSLCDACGNESSTSLSCNCGKRHCPKCFDKHVCPIELPPLKPHQERGIAEVVKAIDDGCKAMCITSPTGGGKTRLAIELIRWAREKSLRVMWYTHRRLLLSQTDTRIQEAGIERGVMAAGYDPALLRDVQVATVQTVNSRVLKHEAWELPQSDIVIVDEAHLLTGKTSAEIIGRHRKAGAVVIGLTATPVNLGQMYDRLIVAGTKHELRQNGMLVMSYMWGPTEPDLELIGQDKIEYTIGEQVNAIKLPKIFGYMYDEWMRLQQKELGVANPHADGKPTILFAPSVPCSRWAAQEFTRLGVAAAHIDGKTDDDERRRIQEGSRDGSIKVVTNRFVLREGIDWPWLEHMIFACLTGKYHTFMQMGGRGLRASPETSKNRLLVQDHGGNWHRHMLSLNDDIEWRLGDTSSKIKKALTSGKRKICPQCHKAELKVFHDERICPACKYSEKAGEPMRCPKCGGMLRCGDYTKSGCPHCGHLFKDSVRMIVQVSGELKPVSGTVRKRGLPKKPSAKEVWDASFWAAVNAKRRYQFDQVRGWFKQRKQKLGLPELKVPYGAWNCPEKGDPNWVSLVRDIHPNLGRFGTKGAKGGQQTIDYDTAMMNAHLASIAGEEEGGV